jgi:hypothetical protein
VTPAIKYLGDVKGEKRLAGMVVAQIASRSVGTRTGKRSSCLATKKFALSECSFDSCERLSDADQTFSPVGNKLTIFGNIVRSRFKTAAVHRMANW